MSNEKKPKEVKENQESIKQEVTPVETTPAPVVEEAPKPKKKVTISPQFVMVQKTDDKGNALEGQTEFALMSHKTVEEPNKKKGKGKDVPDAPIGAQVDGQPTTTVDPAPVIIKRKKRSYISCLCIGLILIISGIALAAAGFPLANVLNTQIKGMGGWAAVIFIVPLLFWCLIFMLCVCPMFFCFGFALPLLLTAKNSDKKSVRVWSIILLVLNIIVMCAGGVYSVMLFIM